MKTVLNKATCADVETAMVLETDAAVRGSMNRATAERIAEFGQSQLVSGECL